MPWIFKKHGSPDRKRKGSDSEDTFARDYKRQRRESPDSTSRQHSNRGRTSEDLTLVQGTLGPQHPYLLGDRLRRVHRIDDDIAFYNRYQEDQFGKLGSGSFGRVCKFLDLKYKKIFAVKIVDKNQAWANNPDPYFKLGMYCEAACFKEILPRHPNIIDVVRIIESPRNIYYVMECFAKFHLKHSFRAFTSAQARTCFFRILQAVDHLHQCGIVHNDLKMENICVRQKDKTDPILIDFGCCQYNSSMVRKRNPTFKEDEIFTDTELRKMSCVNWSADSKDLCYILEMLLTGQPMLQNISSPTLDHFPPKPETDPDALALLDYMRNPNNLPFTTIEQIMQHPWFRCERARARLDHIIDIPQGYVLEDSAPPKTRLSGLKRLARVPHALLASKNFPQRK